MPNDSDMQTNTPLNHVERQSIQFENSIQEAIIDGLDLDNIPDSVPSTELVLTNGVRVHALITKGVNAEEMLSVNTDKRYNIASTIKPAFVAFAAGIINNGSAGLDTVIKEEKDSDGNTTQYNFRDVIDLLLNQSMNQPLIWLKDWISTNSDEYVSRADYQRMNDAEIAKFKSSGKMILEDAIENYVNSLAVHDVNSIKDNEGIRITGSTRSMQSDFNSGNVEDMLEIQSSIFGSANIGFSQNPQSTYGLIHSALSSIPDDATAETNSRIHEIKYMLDQDERRRLKISNIMGKSGLLVSGLNGIVKRLQIQGMEFKQDFNVPADGNDWYKNYYMQEAKDDSMPTLIMIDYSDTAVLQLEDGEVIRVAYNITVPCTYNPFSIEDPVMLENLYGNDSKQQEFDQVEAFQRLENSEKSRVLGTLEIELSKHLMRQTNPVIKQMIFDAINRDSDRSL